MSVDESTVEASAPPRMLDSLRGYTTEDHKSLTEALKAKEKKAYDLGEPFRSPAVELWLEGLEPAQPDDGERFEKLEKKAEYVTQRLEPDGSRACNYTKDFTEADHRELLEIKRRLNNDWLRKNLPMQVADLVYGGIELVESSDPKWEFMDQIRKVIKDGDLRAIAKGLAEQRDHFYDEEERFEWAERVALGKARKEGNFDWAAEPQTSTFVRDAWHDYNRRRARKTNNTVKALAENKLFPDIITSSVEPKANSFPTWSEIVKNPQVPPQHQQPSTLGGI